VTVEDEVSNGTFHLSVELAIDWFWFAVTPVGAPLIVPPDLIVPEIVERAPIVTEGIDVMLPTITEFPYVDSEDPELELAA
jgi:hypothetical protein